jgi:hypothetical protein
MAGAAMKAAWAIAAAASAVSGMPGCTIITKNQGEVGVRYAGEITFFSRATKTDGEAATISLEVPSLEEWILAKAKKENEQTPTTDIAGGDERVSGGAGEQGRKDGGAKQKQ